MKDIFFAICVVSFVPSVLFAVYMILQPVTDRYANAKWKFSALKAVLLLFLVPVYGIVSRLASGLGDYFNISLPAAFIRGTARVAAPMMAPADLGVMTVPETAHAVSVNFWALAATIWLLGMVAIAIYQVYSYRKFMAQTKAITPAAAVVPMLIAQKETLGITAGVGVYYANFADTPMLIGIAQPKILLPQAKAQETQLDYVLAHELTHLKRKDLWWKLALQVISTVHWFNPLVYLFRMEFDKELEYSCDEVVVEALPFDERKKYGFAILQSVKVSSKTNHSFMGVGFSTTKQKLERRITHMLNFKNMTNFTKILSATVALTLLTVIAIPAFASGLNEADSKDDVMTEGVSIIRSNDDGTMEYSADGGKTWEPITDDGFNSTDDSITWKTLTIEDIEKSIAECKANMEDADFMEMMLNRNNFTVEDMENLISSYERQLEEVKAGAVIQEGVNKNGYFVSTMTSPDALMMTDGVGAAFMDEETGKIVHYEADTLELLTVKLEKAVKDGEITEDDMSNMIADLLDSGNPFGIKPYEVLPAFQADGDFEELPSVADAMKRFEKFGVTFESDHAYLGNIFYNGEAVLSLTDENPNGTSMFISSEDGGEMTLEAVYDTNGSLVGVKAV